MKNWFTFIDVGQNLKSPPQKKTLYNYMYTHPHKTRFCGFVIIDTYSPHKLWERQLPNKCIIQMMLSGWLAYYQYLDQFLSFAPLICDLCVLYKVFCSSKQVLVLVNPILECRSLHRVFRINKMCKTCSFTVFDCFEKYSAQSVTFNW